MSKSLLQDVKKDNFNEFLFGLGLNNQYMPNKYDENIFHYTSPNGFNSILFGDKGKVTLWASRYDCLNDMSEGTIVLQIYIKVCEDLLNSEKITKEQYDEIANLKANKKMFTTYKSNKTDEISTTKREECQKYICSFSKNQDSLAMWNYYSKGSKYEGYNIGFDSTEVKAAFNHFYGSGISRKIFPVIYDKIKQQELIKTFLLDILKFYSVTRKEGIKSAISIQLADWSLIFKSEYFQHEEEVRVIISIPKDPLNPIPLEIKYRNNFGYIIPYIELPFEKHCVSDVCIGPLQCTDEQKETQKKILHERLIVNGYNHARETYSKIPIRY